ncbi:MAG: hypothetical protein GXP49_04910 [Deltaproteobacteria bacterium]|nr:hypothetical protein [Deltaproteobacteria bacterium]
MHFEPWPWVFESASWSLFWNTLVFQKTGTDGNGDGGNWSCENMDDLNILGARSPQERAQSLSLAEAAFGSRRLDGFPLFLARQATIMRHVNSIVSDRACACIEALDYL